MDSDVLNSIPDCKKCSFWKDHIGKCFKPRDVDCPKEVRQPRQTSTIDYNYDRIM
jgi:hypothetical protein